ncbi:MAG: aspartate aminotransferase family protein [Planctomycetota bacterium]|jgi:4-aminobutyrate aminotransferase-like enzyme
MTPTEVPAVDTKYRRIQTQLPVPESLKLYERLAKCEPQSMLGQPPIVWDRAEGIQVHDAYGNKWLDWSSGVLICNAGHGRKEICAEIQKVLDKPLLATYVFTHEGRADLCEALQELAPSKDEYSVFLLSTGSESTENAIKLARTYGVKKGGAKKHVIVGFGDAFHGRTLAAQLAGGMPAGKEWIVRTDVGFINTPFPDGFRNEDTSFDQFLKTLEEEKLSGADIAGVISESYQGVGPNFFPKEYAQKLEAWCRSNDVVLIMDEVQAGFGRTGKMFTFEHYDIKPDLICCGKGISSSLPISAVIGRKDIMSLYAPGSMTSTHSASPLPTASAIANLKLLKEEKLVENAAELDSVLRDGLEALREKYPANIGCVMSRGLVAGLLMVKPGTKDPDRDTAFAINEACFRKGLLMFAPVGVGGGCVKIAPPLTTPKDALEDGIAVLAEACAEVLG